MLDIMQRGLAALYETPLDHCVTDFLTTDRELAARLTDDGTRTDNNERLLVRQSADGLDVLLFIDESVLAALDSNDPYATLDADNLNQFLVALEGVSHFHYLTWRATHDRAVTPLELELQAEVDKYVTMSMLVEEQSPETESHELHETLFTRVSFADDAEAPAGRCYRDANQFAARYCRTLARRFPGGHRQAGYLNELRRFYRFSRNAKLQQIRVH